jgi:hypothetical protein
VATGEKEKTIFWHELAPTLDRNTDRREGPTPLARALERKAQRAQQQAPTLERDDRREDSTPLSRALQRKEQRAQQRARVEAEAGPAEAGAAAAPEPERSAPAPANAEPLDIQQLLRRASLLSTIPDAQVADLRQRLIELGPIPEVLQVLQDLLRNEAAAEPDLPQYEDIRRQDV